MKPVKMIEEKHRVRQVLCMKTRGQATLLRGEVGSGIPGLILAKSGISPPPDCADPNGYLVDLYVNRQPGQKAMTRPFVSVRDQWIKEMDVFRLEREVTMNLEYDFKRRPVNPRMVRAGDYEHVAFDTVPWKTVQEGLKARDIFDEWRKTRCLKTVKDFEDWNDYYTCVITFERLRAAGKKVRLQITKEGSRGILLRILLVAYATQQWGLVRTVSFQELAEMLTGIGIETTVDDVKNASRDKAKLEDNIVPPTPRALEMWAKIQLAIGEVFASLQYARLFAV